jgi:hypothetical protein
MKLVAMNDHEELLAKACGCLGEASKIQDPEVRAKVLDLVYHSQRVAQAALAPNIDGGRSNHEASADGSSFAPTQTNAKGSI